MGRGDGRGERQGVVVEGHQGKEGLKGVHIVDTFNDSERLASLTSPVAVPYLEKCCPHYW